MRKNSHISLASILIQLIKARLSLAVTLSSVSGYFISQKDPGTNLVFLTTGVFFLAAAAAVLNQISEIKYDRLMSRTKERPLPLDLISQKSAAGITVFLSGAGILCLSFTGIIVVSLGFAAVILYNLIYTKLKRISILAIIPGAIVGAIPPLMGYEAAGGGIPDPAIIMFSSFVFLWQLPHFWLILIKNRKDYEVAGFVTFPRTITGEQIRNLVFFWVLLSSVFLVGFTELFEVISVKISWLLIPANLLFIVLFLFSLFGRNEKEEYSRAFILINIFNLLIMILFIINSFL
jgi:heme o synthase